MNRADVDWTEIMGSAEEGFLRNMVQAYQHDPLVVDRMLNGGPRAEFTPLDAAQLQRLTEVVGRVIGLLSEERHRTEPVRKRVVDDAISQLRGILK